jgi:hypothetical protein
MGSSREAAPTEEDAASKRTLISVALSRDVPVVPSATFTFGPCVVCRRQFFHAETVTCLCFEWFEGDPEPDEKGEIEGKDAYCGLCPDCAEKSQEELTAFAVDFFDRCHRKSRQ